MQVCRPCYTIGKGKRPKSKNMMDYSRKTEIEIQEKIIDLVESIQSTSRQFFILLVLVIIFAIPLGYVLRFTFFSLLYHPPNLVIYTRPDAQDIQVNEVKILISGPDTYYVYARVANPNANLALRKLDYTFKLLGASDETLGSAAGETYLLPGEDKYIISPSFHLAAPAVRSEFVIDNPEIKWSKVGELRDLQFDFENITWSKSSDRPFFTAAQLKNQNPYIISTLEVIVVLYDLKNQVIGVNTTILNLLQPDEKRFFRVVWPNGVPTGVARAEFKASVNQMQHGVLSTERASFDNYDPRQ